MRFRGVSITMVGAATLLLALAPDADAQRGRMGVLRPAPRASLVGGPLPRRGIVPPRFIGSCVFASPFFPFFGGLPFLGAHLFAGTQPAPDPTSHLAPDPNGQPVPFAGSHPLPGVQPVPGMQPVPGAVGTNPHALVGYAAPVYSAPVYTAPVYAAAAPVATPQVSGGMVVGDVIDDPTFGLWGGWFFGGGGVACVSHRVIIR